MRDESMTKISADSDNHDGIIITTVKDELDQELHHIQSKYFHYCIVSTQANNYDHYDGTDCSEDDDGEIFEIEKFLQSNPEAECDDKYHKAECSLLESLPGFNVFCDSGRFASSVCTDTWNLLSSSDTTTFLSTECTKLVESSQSDLLIHDNTSTANYSDRGQNDGATEKIITRYSIDDEHVLTFSNCQSSTYEDDDAISRSHDDKLYVIPQGKSDKNIGYTYVSSYHDTSMESSHDSGHDIPKLLLDQLQKQAIEDEIKLKNDYILSQQNHRIKEQQESDKWRKLHKMAKLIQTWYRFYKAKKLLKVKAIRYGVTILYNCTCHRLTTQYFKYWAYDYIKIYIYSIIIIQSSMRRWVAIKATKNKRKLVNHWYTFVLLYLHRNSILTHQITIIQNSVRRYLSIQRTQKKILTLRYWKHLITKLNKNVRTQALHVTCSITLQCFMRRISAKTKLKSIRMILLHWSRIVEQIQLAFTNRKKGFCILEQIHSRLLLQRNFHQWICLNKYCKILQTQIYAVRLIQRNYRGYRARKHLSKFQRSNFWYVDSDLEKIFSSEAEYLLSEILDGTNCDVDNNDDVITVDGALINNAWMPKRHSQYSILNDTEKDVRLLGDKQSVNSVVDVRSNTHPTINHNYESIVEKKMNSPFHGIDVQEDRTKSRENDMDSEIISPHQDLMNEWKIKDERVIQSMLKRKQQMLKMKNRQLKEKRLMDPARRLQKFMKNKQRPFQT